MSFTSTNVSEGRRPSGRSQVTTPAAWAADYDLLAFAENLDAKGFTALSQGLGLGELRAAGKVEKRAAPVMREPELPVSTPANYAAAASARRQGQGSDGESYVVDKASSVQVAQVRAEAPERAYVTTRRLSFERRLMAWSIDFLFVTSSLAIALATVTALAAARAKADVSLLDLRPVAWISGFAPYQILLGVYAVYLTYTLTFKFAVGRTFGESLVGLAHKAKRVAEGA